MRGCTATGAAQHSAEHLAHLTHYVHNVDEQYTARDLDTLDDRPVRGSMLD